MEATNLEDTPVLKNKYSGAKIWKKGESGNPKGRPKGSKNKMKELAEGLLGKDAKKIVQKIITLALDGNEACLKMCLDRIIPAQKAVDITAMERRNSDVNIIIGPSLGTGDVRIEKPIEATTLEVDGEAVNEKTIEPHD